MLSLNLKEIVVFHLITLISYQAYNIYNIKLKWWNEYLNEYLNEH